MVFGTSSDPVVLDGAFVSDGESLRVIDQLFETLVTTADGGTDIVPALAKEWSASDDGLVWTFTLQDGVTFHDGTPLNGAAVCFNFDRWYNFTGVAQSAAVSYYWSTVFGGFSDGATPSLYESCEAPDDATAVITLTAPSAAFLSGLAVSSFAIASPDALTKYEADKVGGTEDAPTFDGTFGTEHPIGTGPFKFESWTPGSHLTLVANVGARGRSGGVTETFDDPSTPYLREGYVLLHEAPGHAFVKAGRFVPPFGLRLDDHTTQTRRAMGIDASLPETRVTGLEAGLNPNYPYLHAAWFRRARAGRVPGAFDPGDVDAGSGVAVDAGYREMGWSAGGSAWLEDHPVADGGDSRSWAVYGSFNAWRYRRALPLSYQFEVDRGRWTRASGLETGRAAFYHEADFVLGNGLNLLVAQDWADPDTEVKDDEAFRVCAGVQVVPVPGVTLDLRARMLSPARGGGGSDLFVQVHFWN